MTAQEINEAVAKKMGWLTKPEYGTIRPWWFNGGFYESHPDYAHDITAAMEIVSYLRPVGRSYRLILWENWTYRDSWVAKFENLDSGSGFVQADTAPLAICLAFLKLP